jgi:predicted ATP-binding protein involved in virulence
MRRIQSISIEEIGPFGSLKLDFPAEKKDDCAEIHILTGENGTGKTTILELMSNGLLNRIPGDLHLRRRLTPKEVLRFSLATSDVYPQNLFIYRDNRLMSNLSYVELFFDTVNSKIQKPFDFAIFSYSGYRNFNDSEAKINGIQELHGHPLQNSFDSRGKKDPQQILQWIANTIAAEAIASVQKDDKTSHNRRAAITRLENAISQIVGKSIKFHLETSPYNVKILVDGVALGFNLLPDGFKSIFSWLADLLIRLDRVKWENDTPVFERNFILFLDEIEVHMHPAWQRKILPVVQKLFPNAQIFVSTHSPFVVGSVDGAWIHKLVKPNGDTKLEAGFPILSEDSKGYRFWLNEVFDIHSEYGIEAEQQLSDFYKLRDLLLKSGRNTSESAFLNAGRALSEQSQEIRQIIEMEIRQLNRQLSTHFSL